MDDIKCEPWRDKLVSSDYVLDRIEPGMKVFLGTGVAEPRTLVKELMISDKGNLDDLELIQLISIGDAISIEDRYHRFRLKTFFSGWVASEAITSGRVDLIPCRFSKVPELIASGMIPVDAAIVQICPFDDMGYSSLGVAVDAARQAMEKASLVVGVINQESPWTLGDTLVHVSEFDYLVKSTEPLFYFPRWPVDEVMNKVAENVASLIEDGTCLGWSIGPLFEALGPHLATKKHLGIHGPFFTDSLMDLVKTGAVSNRKKSNFRGKCVTAYALGTRELMGWLHRNPMIEFQGTDVVADPKRVGANDQYLVTLPARKVDLTGGIALHTGRAGLFASPGEAQEYFTGAAFSRGGRTLFALPSRNLKGQPNILLSVKDYPNQLAVRDALDFAVTEYGVAHLTGRTVRERALALIDISHPDDRAELVRLAKEARLLYQDQIYLTDLGYLYPEELATKHTFKGGTVIRFRPIRPSDEEEMRRLFYRFSDEANYYRYFSRIKTMPHSRIQQYVNVDYRKTMSIVGLIGLPGEGRIVAEVRYVRLPDRPFGDIAMVVDEEVQGIGVASYMMKMLIRIAKERGLKGFTADVLSHNKPMWKVLQKSGLKLQAEREPDSIHLTMPFDEPSIESS